MHTQSRPLEDHEEQFAVFDKKCNGLELRTIPLMGNGAIIYLYTVIQHIPIVYNVNIPQLSRT